MLPFWLLLPFGRDISPRLVRDQPWPAQELLCFARLFLPTGRAPRLSALPPFGWAKRPPHLSTGGPHLPSLFIFPFISIPLLRCSLSFACCLRPALPFPQPPPPSWLPGPVLATPSPPSRPATPQSPLSHLGPSVLTLACQLALRSESKSKAVCCEKMEKWRNDRG